MDLFYTIRPRKSSGDEDQGNDEKFRAIVEIVFIVFLTTFIPSLIKLGRPPTSIGEIWVELLVALLASLYAYSRIRGIDLEGGQ